MRRYRRLLLLIIIAFLLSLAGALWAMHILSSKKAPLPAVDPPSTSQPALTPVAASETPLVPTPEPTDTIPADTTPPPVTVLDYSGTGGGFIDTPSFTSPVQQWVVDVTFTAVEPNDQALLFVMDAGTECQQTPPDRFGCGVIHVVDVNAPDGTAQFSFYESHYDDQVYLKLAAGQWHVTATAFGQPAYRVVDTQLLPDQTAQ